MNRDEIVELITREVMREMGKQKAGAAGIPGLPSILVIGDIDRLPDRLSGLYAPVGISQYGGPEDSVNYKAVYITELKTDELVEMALGRSAHPASCAVVNALLRGIPVYLMDSAIEHRRFKNTAKMGFYHLLEGYVHSLQNYGVILMSGQVAAPAAAQDAVLAADQFTCGLINEAKARSIVSTKDDECLVFEKGTILTPTAKDIFLHAGRKVQFL
ncbi:MAG: hypothetical protein LKM35_06340 [Lachnospiraceae bacterium]|jgi:hypothetical protein|nr:hypothetical protein [Lachnospiraceae bacterium]MCI1727294.1 hypothetical protein [Lachnospiraceae bacterium]